MNVDRYPPDLIVTAEHFAKSGWKAIIAGTKRKGYSAMWSAFSNSAKQALEEGRTAEGKVLWLFADACSMMLKPKHINEPFSPSFVMQGRRSALPGDLSTEDISFFIGIIEEIDDPWLRGRLADLVWLCSKPCDLKYALMAIDAYRKLPLDADTWIHGGRECWDRAIRLALTLGDGSGNRLIEMRDAILAAFEKTTHKDNYLGVWLSDLLNEHQLARLNARSIAEHLEKVAKDFEDKGDIHRCRDYFDRASKWFKTAKDTAKSAEMTVAVAECWVREAQARVSSEQPSHMVAASFYENAIQVYRMIPRSERGPHSVDARINELRDSLNEAGAKSLDEMGTISTPDTDISEMIKHAQGMVRGKEAPDALGGFVNLNRVDAKSIRETAIQTLRDHPLMGLFPATVVSSDGRVIAKHNGMGLGDSEIEGNNNAIWFEMIRHHSIIIALAVQGSILPAHEVLLQEHRIHENDFTDLCIHSPIVPKDRARLWGKALYAGYDGDFVTAIHLLSPQIENMVRTHLKASGAKTTNLNQNGIETENGLSTLMDMPEVDKVLPENLTFEIRALFCNPFGSNLRNVISHGLISFDGCHSVYSIYAWWFALRIVFNTYWNAAHKSNTDQSTENSA